MHVFDVGLNLTAIPVTDFPSEDDGDLIWPGCRRWNEMVCGGGAARKSQPLRCAAPLKVDFCRSCEKHFLIGGKQGCGYGKLSAAKNKVWIDPAHCRRIDK